MAEPPPNPQLLTALGRLARGLSALFWGLPLALVACVQTAKGDFLRPFGILPPLVTTGLLLHGLLLLGHFQKQERVWRDALEHARILAIVNLGLSPFLYWYNKVPGEIHIASVASLMIFTGLLFLLALNRVLRRLTAMLPDETLRLETRVFTTLNRGLLWFTLGLAVTYFALDRLQTGAGWPAVLLELVNRSGTWWLLFLVLLPVAMTMALLWKVKEVILASVFGPEA